jgi:hypothetical protein
MIYYDILYFQRHSDDLWMANPPLCHEAKVSEISEPTKTMDFYSEPIDWKTPNVRQSGA